jgi:hypothetical protein
MRQNRDPGPIVGDLAPQNLGDKARELSCPTPP